jgi:anti-repressor protein
MFNLAYSQAKQVLVRESKVVRKAVIKRLEVLESENLKSKESLNNLPIINSSFLQQITDRVKQLEIQNKEKTIELEQAKPAIEFTNTVQNSINSITVQEFAKICGSGQKKMFLWLREKGFLMQNNQPYQKFLDNGCFKFIEKSYLKKGESYTYFQTLVTGKGQIQVQKKWLETPVKLLEINNQNI